MSNAPTAFDPSSASTGAGSLVSRRAFLVAAAAVAGSAQAPAARRADRFRFGVQLYPLQARFAADMPGLFRELAQSGFRSVEFASFGARSASEIRIALATAGLKPFGSHCLPLALSDDEARRQLDLCAEIGVPGATTALASVRPTEARPNPPMSAVFKGLSVDDLRWSAARMSLFAGFAKERGLVYSYHTHNVDFAPVEDRPGLDWLMQLTDPRAVGLQLDIGNTIVAGVDPLRILRKYRGRVRSVHVKDWVAGFVPTFGLNFPQPAPLGSGATNWPKVMRTLAEDRIQDILIEQERAPGTDSLAAQVQALIYLRSL